MKSIALILLLSSALLQGSGTRWTTVHLPTYVLHVDEGPSEGTIKVPCVTSSNSGFERQIGLMNSVYVPHHATWNVPADVNLITLYGLTISGSYDRKSDPKHPRLIVVIDCTKSVIPEGYPYSVDQVVEKVKTCIKLNLNPKVIEVRPKNKKSENKSE